MFRSVLVPALLALLLIPDWASALGRRRPSFAGRAQPVAVSYPVQYSQPVYYSTPQPVYSMPAPTCCPCPVASTPAPMKPTVVPERMEPKDPPKLKPMVQSEPLAAPKAVDPDASFKPATGTTETIPTMKEPVPVLPMVKPKESIPIIPDTKPAAPSAIEIQPLPTLKLNPDPKKEEFKPAPLPKLDLPSIPPLVDPEPLPKPTTVKSSPLNAYKVERFAVDGPVPTSPDALRRVTFFNFSGQDLTLTLAGKTVIVPSKHRVEAELPGAFRWMIGEVEQSETVVPATAPGLEVIIGK